MGPCVATIHHDLEREPVSMTTAFFIMTRTSSVID
jgi:hypothetical protein